MLTVTTSPNFASKWLVHRLGRFAEAHPSIDLRISASVQHIDFAREDIDIAIRHGDGQWPQLTSFASAWRSCSRFAARVPKWPSCATSAQRPEAPHASPRRQPEQLGQVAGGGRYHVRKPHQRAGIQPGNHGYRCRHRWTGHRFGADRACGPGPGRWSPRPSLCSGLEGPLRLLGRVPESNADLPKIATFREWLLPSRQRTPSGCSGSDLHAREPLPASERVI